MKFLESPAFLQKVAEWNARYQRDGWQSLGMELECPHCNQPRGMALVTTVNGKTTVECSICGVSWRVTP